MQACPNVAQQVSSTLCPPRWRHYLGLVSPQRPCGRAPVELADHAADKGQERPVPTPLSPSVTLQLVAASDIIAALYRSQIGS